MARLKSIAHKRPVTFSLKPKAVKKPKTKAVSVDGVKVRKPHRYQ